MFVFILLVSRGRFPLFGPYQPVINSYPALIPQPIIQPIPVPVQVQPPPPPYPPPPYSPVPSTRQTCLCVPLGTCTGVGINPVISPPGQTGAIDIRIVNNVTYDFIFVEVKCAWLL